MKPKFNVTEVVVVPGLKPSTTVVPNGRNLSASKAGQLRDKLESANETADFNPNRIVSYLVAPAA